MAIGFERDTFLFQEHALTTPSRSSAPLFVDNTVAGQLFGTWCIAQRTSHHPGMAWPSSPGSNNTIGSNPSVRYLTDDIQHIITKLVRLFGSHSVWIKKFYLHLLYTSSLVNDTAIAVQGERRAELARAMLSRSPQSPLLPHCNGKGTTFNI